MQPASRGLLAVLPPAEAPQLRPGCSCMLHSALQLPLQAARRPSGLCSCGRIRPYAAGGDRVQPESSGSSLTHQGLKLQLQAPRRKAVYFSAGLYGQPAPEQ